MSTPEVLTDQDRRIAMEALAKGEAIPPEVARRIQEGAEKVRAELLRTRGLTSSGVLFIREIRGDLPNP